MEETLQQIGLSPEETEIYLTLLNKGSLSAAQIGSFTKVKRTYVYKIVEGLMQKGLVSQNKESRTTVFAPNSPDHLLTLANKKKEQAENAHNQLEAYLGNLRVLFGAVDSKPTVQYFEGIEGIKKVYLDTLKHSGPLLALVETSSVHPEIYNWVTEKYVYKRVEAGIEVKAIVSTGEKTENYVEKNKEELRETKVIPSRQYPFKHELNIYGDKVAILNHNKDSELLGIIIENKLIAETFKAWFELTWGGIKLNKANK